MSWVSDMLKAFENGAVGLAVPEHDQTKPLAGVLGSLNTAASNVASTLSGAAVSTVDGFLETHVGTLGTEVANVALEALISEAQSRLAPTTAAAV